ncbi:MAG: hypothetical protein A3C63_01375 [Candidatus Zambryskibacteria bacterium RIFCSPHIGHO2_02_FULL_39_82]|nr:MAG: hypothetical protein A3C63_01375 [Candidatus Zambryskibacteria bacterium RIFCSPHIGHO2_02_FULL_39_82]
MSKLNDVKIFFCFPNSTIKTKGIFVDALIRDVQPNRKVGYAGYLKKVYLHKHLSGYFNSKNINTYRPLLAGNKNKIEKIIQLVAQKCLEQLPLSSLFVFIFPWLGEKYNTAFGGVNGFAPYASTVHLFISLTRFSSQSLKETLAHEFSHAVFFYYHKSALKLTLLETLVFEGLAENFREEVVGEKPSSWSTALNKKQCVSALLSLKQSLYSRKYDLYHDVFFGSKKYKRWTGYSIGYKIIKSFRETYPEKSWKEVMKMKPETIFAMSPFTKKEV